MQRWYRIFMPSAQYGIHSTASPTKTIRVIAMACRWPQTSSGTTCVKTERCGVALKNRADAVICPFQRTATVLVTICAATTIVIMHSTARCRWRTAQNKPDSDLLALDDAMAYECAKSVIFYRFENCFLAGADAPYGATSPLPPAAMRLPPLPLSTVERGKGAGSMR